MFDECLKPLGLTITDASEGLGVTRQTLSRVISGQTEISAGMAVRPAKAFGGTAEIWLRQQMMYDLAQIREEAERINVRKFVVAWLEEQIA